MSAKDDDTIAFPSKYLFIIETSRLDEQKFKGFRWLALFMTGMGVFTDGYDLASAGVVLPLVLASFGINHLTGFETSALAQNGRKRCYGFDVILGVASSPETAQPLARRDQLGRRRRTYPRPCGGISRWRQ